MKFLTIFLGIFFVIVVASAGTGKEKSKDKVAKLKKGDLHDDIVVVEATPFLSVAEDQEAKAKPPKLKLDGVGEGERAQSSSRAGRQYDFAYAPFVPAPAGALIGPGPGPGPELEPDYYGEEGSFENLNVVIAPPSKRGDFCVNPHGEGGKCVPLKKCYQVMEGNDLDGDGIYEGNMELAQMLLKSSAGSCHNDDPIKYLYSQDGSVVLDGPGHDLVCCVGNFTEEEISLDVRTVGGRVSPRNQYPYIVALMNNGRHFCGGSLINSNHVLTAAHCVAHMGGGDVARMTVQIGDHDIYSRRDGYSEVRRVIRVVKHRWFNPRTLYYDVAILTLSQGVPFNAYIKPVSMSGQYSTTGFARVAGWGKLSEFGPFPAVLHHVEVEMMTNQKCQGIYGRAGSISEHMICAGSTRADACSGDSGGPLIVNGNQVGIVSWGIGCARYPGVYTRVGSFLDWIRRNQNG